MTQHCKTCDKLFETAQVKLSLGEDSPVLAGGYCSARCYTDDFLTNSGIDNLSNLASHGVSVIKYWMDKASEYSIDYHLLETEMKALIDGIHHAINDHPHVINVEKIEFLLMKHERILDKHIKPEHIRPSDDEL